MPVKVLVGFYRRRRRHPAADGGCLRPGRRLAARGRDPAAGDAQVTHGRRRRKIVPRHAQAAAGGPRQKGQVARSSEFGAALTLLAVVLALHVLLPGEGGLSLLRDLPVHVPLQPARLGLYV